MCSINYTRLDWRCSDDTAENETLCCINSGRHNETNLYQQIHPKTYFGDVVLLAVDLLILLLAGTYLVLLRKKQRRLIHKLINHSIDKVLNVTELRDIGLSVGYDCLELTDTVVNKKELDELDDLIFTYAMDILSLALHQIRSPCTTLLTLALDQYSKNVLTTLEHRLPVSKKTILETMLTAAGNVIRFHNIGTGC